MKIRNFKVINNSYNLYILNRIMLLLDERDIAHQIIFSERYFVKTDELIRNHLLIYEKETRDVIYTSLKNRIYPFSYLVEKVDFSVLRTIIPYYIPNKFKDKVEITDEILSDYLVHGITTGLIDYHINSDTVSLSLSGMELLDSYNGNI